MSHMASYCMVENCCVGSLSYFKEIFKPSFVTHKNSILLWDLSYHVTTFIFTSGLEATPLTRGYDCPADAEYIDAAMFDNGYGELWMKEDVLCVFEYR